MSRAARIASLHAQALSVFTEAFVTDRRAIVIGDATLGAGERLLELGARTVHVFDPEPIDGLTREPVRGLSVQTLPAADFDVRDGAFDLALITDIGEFDEPAAVVARLRRVVADDGALVCAAKNPAQYPGEGVDYTELFDLVALQFAHVAVFGQLAWGGVAFARLGEDQDGREVSVDSQLVAEPPPIDGYVLVASQRPFAPDPYVIVQLPSASDDDVVEPSGLETVALTEVSLRAELLAAQLEEQRVVSSRLAQELHANRAGAPNEAAREVIERAESRAAQAELRAQQEFARAERLVQNARDIAVAVDEERDELKRLGREVENERRARKKLDLENQLLRERVEQSEVPSLRTLPHAMTSRLSRMADVETTVAFRGDELAGLQTDVSMDEGTAEIESARRSPDSGEALTIPRADQLTARAQAAEAKTLAAEERVRSLEGLLRDAETRIRDGKMRAEEAEQRAEEAEGRFLQLEDEVASAEGRAQLAEEIGARYAAEASTIGDAIAMELAAQEARLRERGQAIAELERETVRRERLVHELVDALQEARAVHALDSAILIERTREVRPTDGNGARPLTPDPRVAEELASLRAENERAGGKFDALTHELARYQGELFARDWRIEELEQNLVLADAGSSAPPSVRTPAAQASSSASSEAPSEAEVERLRSALAHTEEELDSLRQALTQEHAARVRAESVPPQK